MPDFSPAHRLRYLALVPAAGSGARMAAGQGVPKQYLPLAGHPMIWHALVTLCGVPRIERVVVVLAPDDAWWQDGDFAGLGDKLLVVRCGGSTRAESVRNGLNALPALLNSRAAEFEPGLRVLVHDAARPCLTLAQVNQLIDEVGDSQSGGLLAIPVADTLKRADEAGKVTSTAPRAGLWQAQTPQMFPWQILTDALNNAPDLTQVTDESSAVEALGLAPRLVASDAFNLKVTYPRDLLLAEHLLTLGQKST
jgi:2-C-methyl-D-erythritol 4-phosphate cytidylyltransferase